MKPKKIIQIIFIVLIALLVNSSSIFASVPTTSSMSNGRIVFSSLVDGMPELFIMDSSGENVHQLTTNTYGYYDEAPVFSPDGNFIVFQRGYGWDYTELRIISTEDAIQGIQTSRLLYAPNNRVAAPDWSPDGLHIVFQVGCGAESNLFIIPSDAEVGVNDIQPTQITFSCGAENSPTWSPNGRMIATTSSLDNECTYYGEKLFLTILYTDGITPSQILHDQYGNLINKTVSGRHLWSQDGSQLLFVRYVDGYQRLAIADLNLSQNLATLHYVPGIINNSDLNVGDWLPDGRILFTSYGELCAINQDGTDLDCFSEPNLVSYADFVSINLPPSIELDSHYSTIEGTTIVFSPEVIDPEDDTLTYHWSYDPNDGNCLFSNYSSSTTNFFCQDNGEYNVVISVSDGVNEPVLKSILVDILNAPPEIDEISLSSNPIEINDQVTMFISFHDNGVLDTHDIIWEWGDGTATFGFVNEENGFGIATNDHRYNVSDVYTIKIIAKDNDGGETESIYQNLVVYDPEGGFITGGGWINSFKGAYLANPLLEGKASFGFVAKYINRGRVPSGSTEFQLKIADLNFKSTGYDWLLVSGSKAFFKGSGTINNTGDYRFLISVIDGKFTGKENLDKLRIKIWDHKSNMVVYDNMLGMNDFSDPTVIIEGGNITIHK